MPNTKKLLVKAHAKHLMAGAEAEHKERMEMYRAKSEAEGANGGDSKRAEVRLDNLYDLLYDHCGQSKAGNLNQKVVINGPTLEILESQGNAVSFAAVTSEEAELCFESMKWNKSLKIVNPVPRFQSVPATAHLFDVAGGDLDFKSIEAEAAQFKIKSSMLSSIGSFFGRGRK